MELVVDGLPESDGVVFRAAPAGVYDARIVAVEESKASDKSKHPGAPQFIITVKLQDEEYDGIQVKSWYQVPNGAMDAEEIRRSTAQIARLWKACGLDTEDTNIDTDDLLHQDLRVQLGVEKYNGNDTNRVNDVLASE